MKKKFQTTKGVCWRTLAFSLFMIIGFVTYAHPPFVIDGNPADWVHPDATSLPTYTKVSDPFGNGVVDNQFTEGTKDFTPAAQKIWTMGQTKGKNDIANGAAVLIGNHLYFAGDRAKVQGSAQIGFWFFLNGTGPIEDPPGSGGGYFAPDHAIGDLLILSDFSQGGRFATVKVYRWDGIDSQGNGILTLIEADSEVATNNDVPYPVPAGWDYVSATYPANAFYEGFVDLEALNLENLCFSSFMIETRSSKELTAMLDDFVWGSFTVVPDPPVTMGDERCGPGMVTLSATRENGNVLAWFSDPELTIQVAGDVETFEPFLSATATYYVTQTNEVGCVSQAAMVTGTINPEPVISLEATDLLCNGDNSGEIEVSWTSGTGPFDLFLDGELHESDVTSPFDITGLAAGDYTVRIVDANGCYDEDMVTVDEPELLEISLVGTDLLCYEDGTGAIEVTFSGGTGPFDLYLDGELYESEVTSPFDITGLDAGDYNVEIVDANGCKADDDVTLSEPDELIVSLDGTDLLCFEDGTGAIEVTFSGGTGPFDLYLNGELHESNVTSPFDITGLDAGDYNVEIVDANGCKADDDVTLSEPDELLISLVGTDLLCNDDGTGEIEVSWSGGTGPFDLYLNGELHESDVTSPFDITGLDAGDYNVEIVDANGCKVDDDVMLYEPELLECSIELISDASCEGADGVATVTVTGGTGPFSIVWSNGEEGETAYELTPGLHSVTVTDANGCETTCEVTVGEEPCEEDCETFYAKGPEGVSTCFIDGGFSSNWGWTNLIGPGTYEWPLYASAGGCDLTGATNVGMATVVYGLDGVVTVTIDMAPGFTLNEQHIYAGYRPYPGPGIGTWRNEGPFDGSPVYVIVHGVVCGYFSSSPAVEPVTELAKAGEISLSIGPNPFRDQASIRVISDVDTKASVEVYNMLGVRVATLHEGALNAHEVYNFNFTANSRSQQFYMVVVRTPFGVTSSKILQVR